MSTQDDRNRGIQRSQWLLFSALAGAVLLVVALWIGAGSGNNAPQLRGIDAQLAGPGEAEAGWVRQSETRFGGIEARLRDIESRNLRLEDDNSRLQLQLREQAEAGPFGHRPAGGADRRTDRARRQPVDGACDRAVRAIGCATAGGDARLDRAG